MQMVLISECRERVMWELCVSHLQHVDTDYKRNTATDDGCPLHYMPYRWHEKYSGSMTITDDTRRYWEYSCANKKNKLQWHVCVKLAVVLHVPCYLFIDSSVTVSAAVLPSQRDTSGRWIFYFTNWVDTAGWYQSIQVTALCGNYITVNQTGEDRLSVISGGAFLVKTEKRKIQCIECQVGLLRTVMSLNPLNAELNPICYLLALLGAHHLLHVSGIRVKLLTFRLLMSYI